MFIYWLHSCLSHDTCLFCCCFSRLIILFFVAIFAWWFVSFVMLAVLFLYNICVCLYLCLLVIAGRGSPRNWLVLVCLRTSLRLLCLPTVTDVVFACPVCLCMSVLTHSLPFLPPLRVPPPQCIHPHPCKRIRDNLHVLSSLYHLPSSCMYFAEISLTIDNHSYPCTTICVSTCLDFACARIYVPQQTHPHPSPTISVSPWAFVCTYLHHTCCFVFLSVMT